MMNTPAPLLDVLSDAETRLVEQRHPLRFVWRMDDEERFSIAAGDFIALVGAPTVAVLESRWSDIAQALDLDAEARVTRAIASHDTWSGIGIDWPVEATTERLPVVLSGLPVLARDGSFSGYRGFGVCRDVGQIAAVIAARRAAVTPPTPAHGPPTIAAEASSAPATDIAVAQPAPTTAEPDHSRGALPFPETRPRLTVVPTAKNVVPLRAHMESDKRPLLSTVERNAFQEIARALGARLEGDETASPPPSTPAQERGPDAEAPPAPTNSTIADAAQDLAAALCSQIATDEQARAALDRQTAGTESDSNPPTQDTDPSPPDEAGAAHEPPIRPEPVLLSDAPSVLQPVYPCAPAGPEGAVLDRLPVGVLVYRGDAVILANHALLEWTGFPSLDALSAAGGLGALFPASAPAHAPETDAPQALAIRTSAGDALIVDTRLFTLGLDDGTALLMMFTRTPGGGRHKQTAKASSEKSSLLAKISYEVRTPLNTIVEFSEVMLEQRLGPIENERYRAFVKDIHASGEQVRSLLNDLLDLSKIEAGKFDLAMMSVDVNDVVQQCVAEIQPAANSERIIIRSALSARLPPALADARAVRGIVLNLLSNSIKCTGAGGQVIVSTTSTDAGEAVMRVRDTGVGMSEQNVETTLEPLHHGNALSGLRTGFGLPLAKALAEANGASFRATSSVEAGTLVEVIFLVTPAPAGC